MPISPDPNAFADFKTEVRGISFKCRFLTRRQRLTIGELQAKAIACKSMEESIPILMEAINIGVVLNGTPLDEMLSDMEIWELAFGFPTAVLAQESDLKKSVQQSKLEQAASSAADAPKPA